MVKLKISTIYGKTQIETTNEAYWNLHKLNPNHELLGLITPCIDNLGIRPDRKAFVKKYHHNGEILSSGESFKLVIECLPRYESDLRKAIAKEPTPENGKVTETPNLVTLVSTDF